MDSHFLFHGDPTARDRAFSRMRRAIRDLGTGPRNTNMPHIANLEEHLKDHVVEVTPTDGILNVLTYPAVDAGWELTLDVTTDDRVVNMVLGDIAPPPGKSP